MRITPFLIGAAVTTSAAAIGLASSQAAIPAAASSPYDATAAMLESRARDAQRARIETRYEIDRARCDALRGAEHDRCLIEAHASRGRALLEAAAPYQRRR